MSYYQTLYYTQDYTDYIKWNISTVINDVLKWRFYYKYFILNVIKTHLFIRFFCACIHDSLQVVETMPRFSTLSIVSDTKLDVIGTLKGQNRKLFIVFFHYPNLFLTLRHIKTY